MPEGSFRQHGQLWLHFKVMTDELQSLALHF